MRVAHILPGAGENLGGEQHPAVTDQSPATGLYTIHVHSAIERPHATTWGYRGGQRVGGKLQGDLGVHIHSAVTDQSSATCLHTIHVCGGRCSGTAIHRDLRVFRGLEGLREVTGRPGGTQG